MFSGNACSPKCLADRKDGPAPATLQFSWELAVATVSDKPLLLLDSTAFGAANRLALQRLTSLLSWWPSGRTTKSGGEGDSRVFSDTVGDMGGSAGRKTGQSPTLLMPWVAKLNH